MTKPAVLAVDDELEVLNAVERALRKHFATDYRMLKTMWNRGRGPAAASSGPRTPLPPVAAASDVDAAHSSLGVARAGGDAGRRHLLDARNLCG